MNFQALLSSVTTQQRRVPVSLSLRKSTSHNSSSFPMNNVFRLLTLAVALLLACLAQQVNGDGPNCMQNGMGPQNLYQNGEMNPDYMWSRAGSKIYVPVVMDESYTPKQLQRILGGFKEIQKKTCVEFHYFNNHTVGNLDHVYVTKQREGCWSYIGRIGGRQEMSLPRGCMSHRTAVHEMIHALGFAHEHVRSDRDNYITVHWKNIMPGRERNFVKRKTKSSDPYGPYDYGSIMHYERGAFSFNGQDTITPKDDGARIGEDHRMSHWDQKKVSRMYRCDNLYGGGGGTDFGHGHGFGYGPEENELSNFIEGHPSNDGHDDGPGHAPHGHGGHRHEAAVADGPEEVFGYESSPDDHPVHHNAPVHHRNQYRDDDDRSHSPGHRDHGHVEQQGHVDYDDGDFSPTVGPYGNGNRQGSSRGRGYDHHPPQGGRSYGFDSHDAPDYPNDGPNHNYVEESPGPDGLQDSPFPSRDTEFQSHPSYGSGGTSPNGAGSGAHSYSHREDSPIVANELNNHQPTVFDGPSHFFESCFPFC